MPLGLDVKRSIMPGQINVDGQRIARARCALGKDWTQGKLAEELSKSGAEITRAQIANIESGRTLKLSFNALKALANILNKPVEYFSKDIAAMQEERRYYALEEGRGRIPVVGTVNAASFNFSFDTPTETYLRLRIDIPGDRRAVALRVSGDCMVDPKDPQHSLYDGDYVVVLEQSNCSNGQIGVFRLDGEFTLKRVFKVKDHYELRPANPKYEPIIVREKEFKIVGVVIDKVTPMMGGSL